jgi:hypothetical protein
MCFYMGVYNSARYPRVGDEITDRGPDPADGNSCSSFNKSLSDLTTTTVNGVQKFQAKSPGPANGYHVFISFCVFSQYNFV